MDYFHELIMIDELSRCGSGGVLWGLFGGLSIGGEHRESAAAAATAWPRSMRSRLLCPFGR